MVEVKLHSSLTLECPVPTADFVSRKWYINPTYLFQTIYSQDSTGITKGSMARDDWSVDSATFNLSIGRVTFSDVIFSCSATTQQGTKFGVVFVAVYSESMSY